jgi:hypothetical protein
MPPPLGILRKCHPSPRALYRCSSRSDYCGLVGLRLGLILAILLVAVGGASAAIGTRLTIRGAFHTTSAQAVRGTFEDCGYRSTHTLIYESKALRIGRGPAVARVEFFIPGYRGPRRYNATAPAPYHRTAVQVVTGRNATTGIASGFYIAKSGSIAVIRARNVGRRGHEGSVSGTVHATLRLQGGTRRLRLDGSWHCRIAPEANGG